MVMRALRRLRDDGTPFERALVRSAENDAIPDARRSGFFTAIEAAVTAPSGVIAIYKPDAGERPSKRRRAR